MISAHDTLGVMSTEEILKKNVYDLQEQLVFANKRVASLADKMGYVISIHKDLEYHLQGIEGYITDIKELLNEGK
jgi:hypothetical protein